MIGPLLNWELIRVARRGYTLRSRAILLFCVLAALFSFTLFKFRNIPFRTLFLEGPELRIEESASFGEQFSLTFLFSQLLIVVCLTPAYAAGGLAEEKEKGTFDFLMVTDLTNREIILGSFFSRLILIYCVVLTGLPILMLTLLYGGVHPRMVLGSYSITIATVTFLAAISLLSAIFAKTYRSAMFRAYTLSLAFALIGGGCFFLSPFFIMLMLKDSVEHSAAFLGLAVAYPGLLILFSIVLVAVAIQKLRAHAAPIASSPDPIPTQQMKKSTRTRTIVETKPRPPINDENPLLWKERHVSLAKVSEDDDSILGLKFTGGILIVAVLLPMLCIEFTIVFPIVFWVILMQMGLTTCGSINGERARNTWESLLTIPVERSELWFAKCHYESFGIQHLINFANAILIASVHLLQTENWLNGGALLLWFLVCQYLAPSVGVTCSSIVSSKSKAYSIYLIWASIVVGFPVWLVRVVVESPMTTASILLIGALLMVGLGFATYRLGLKQMTTI